MWKKCNCILLAMQTDKVVNENTLVNIIMYTNDSISA